MKYSELLLPQRINTVPRALNILAQSCYFLSCISRFLVCILLRICLYRADNCGKDTSIQQPGIRYCTLCLRWNIFLYLMPSWRGRGLYDENIELLYIPNVTISIVQLHLLFHNLGSEDNLLGFITIIFIFQNELLS